MEASPKDILVKYGNLFVEAFRKSLLKHDRYVSGNLSQSIIAMPVKVMGQKMIVEIRADDYFNYVNEGVSGMKTKYKTPYSFRKGNIKQSAMLAHIANRGIDYKGIQNYYKNSKGLKVKRKKPLEKQKALNTLAFLMGRKLAKKGIKPTHFADEVIESNIRLEMEKELSKSIGRLIKVELRKAIDGNNDK